MAHHSNLSGSCKSQKSQQSGPTVWIIALQGNEYADEITDSPVGIYCSEYFSKIYYPSFSKVHVSNFDLSDLAALAIARAAPPP